MLDPALVVAERMKFYRDLMILIVAFILCLAVVGTGIVLLRLN
jgi:hypothetical protein